MEIRKDVVEMREWLDEQEKKNAHKNEEQDISNIQSALTHTYT